MATIVNSATGAHSGADALLARLSQLQSEVREVGQQLDRLETEVWRVLNVLTHEQFEEYR
jgi:hypothetical protein